ncbi:hypothetical protein V474_14660 [Novosphingobium barchaimii LL02]|uniref:Uncharacterized protein n=1 Tax=Novosphingobium barchaimii LL02 TaxID=1114963 RepID=A0A0J8AQF1_9SPHN|nr:hypothetical protein V474_14660 [Novosphingobium barchaimii LL02]
MLFHTEQNRLQWRRRGNRIVFVFIPINESRESIAFNGFRRTAFSVKQHFGALDSYFIVGFVADMDYHAIVHFLIRQKLRHSLKI